MPIESFMQAYWDKYPQEIENDYTLEEIQEFIDDGVCVYISEHLFILYEMEGDDAYIICYWCDSDGYTLSLFRKIHKEHKEFIHSFKGGVYIENLKTLFKRQNMVEYCEKRKLWRYL